MANVIPQRMSAQIEGDFVVFLIGMRINKPWKLHKWFPVFLAMPKMLKELEEFGAAESLPKMEGRRMIVMIAPKKKK